MVALPEGGFWYQPASLWSIAYVDGVAETPGFVRANFNRQHFRNSTRHPIKVNRFSLCGVNYPFAIQNIAGFVGPLSAESAMFNKAAIKIAAPFTKAFSRFEIPLASYSPRPTGWQSGATLSDSSLVGVNYLKLDKPVMLPRKSALEIGLTGAIRMSTGAFGLPGSDVPRAGRFFFHEKGGLFSGSSRQKVLTVTQGANIAPLPDSYSGIPYAIPPAYVVAVEAATGPIVNWPPLSQMNARDFEQQEGTRSGSTEVYGMGVFIDQIDYDNQIEADVLATQATAAGPLYKISMTASLIGCRARAMHAPGSNDWWWRPGAPLCLVLDTITDALVYDLPEEVTLGPGDCLDVSLFLPVAPAEDASAPLGYQVGISFNGYTAIEG